MYTLGKDLGQIDKDLGQFVAINNKVCEHK